MSDWQRQLPVQAGKRTTIQERRQGFDTLGVDKNRRQEPKHPLRRHWNSHRPQMSLPVYAGSVSRALLLVPTSRHTGSTLAGGTPSSSSCTRHTHMLAAPQQMCGDTCVRPRTLAVPLSDSAVPLHANQQLYMSAAHALACPSHVAGTQALVCSTATQTGALYDSRC